MDNKREILTVTSALVIIAATILLLDRVVLARGAEHHPAGNFYVGQRPLK
jgi:hypothetical protein